LDCKNLFFDGRTGPSPYFVAHENPEDPHDAPPVLNADIFLSVRVERHDGQGGFSCVVDDMISSKLAPQSLQVYS